MTDRIPLWDEAPPGVWHDAETANRLLVRFQEALATVVKFCFLKRSGFCYKDCPAVGYCKKQGLTVLLWIELPEEFRRSIDAG